VKQRPSARTKTISNNLTASGASFRAAATYICGNLELSDRDKNKNSSICFLEL